MGSVPDTIIVFTTRMGQLADFYRAGLGLDAPVSTSDAHTGFALDNVYLGFDQVDDEVSSNGSNTTVWFRVDDIHATFSTLVELGATIRYEPQEKYFGEIVAAVYDPDGNLLGLSQRKA